jgi:hypothetical protein
MGHDESVGWSEANRRPRRPDASQRPPLCGRIVTPGAHPPLTGAPNTVVRLPSPSLGHLQDSPPDLHPNLPQAITYSLSNLENDVTNPFAPFDTDQARTGLLICRHFPNLHPTTAYQPELREKP